MTSLEGLAEHINLYAPGIKFAVVNETLKAVIVYWQDGTKSLVQSWTDIREKMK